MSIRIQIKCDHCCHMSKPAGTLAEARQKARKAGWTLNGASGDTCRWCMARASQATEKEGAE